MATAMHLVLVGACYVDTILTVPHFPAQDSKLRATSLSVRRGGNCPNTLEVLLQLLARDGSERRVVPHLVSPLPRRSSPATQRILGSFAGPDGLADGLADDGPDGLAIDGPDHLADTPLFRHCLYRHAHSEPASSYIIRSTAASTRTIVNYNALPDMTLPEFHAVARSFGAAPHSWWHFEGRTPETTLACMHLLRNLLPAARISVEVEKPDRPGLEALAAEADVVFYSRAWAESRRHQSAGACLTAQTRRPGSIALCTWGADGAALLSDHCCLHCPVEHPAAVVDTVGAGDTFTAGVLYGLVCRASSWSLSRTLHFGVRIASLKVQREGFQGLAAALDDAAISI